MAVGTTGVTVGRAGTVDVRVGTAVSVWVGSAVADGSGEDVADGAGGVSVAVGWGGGVRVGGRVAVARGPGRLPPGSTIRIPIART